MKRVVLTLIATAALSIATALPIASSGLTLVTLTCNDGTDITAEVDADTLEGLVQSVEALTLYPAGLSCTLVQTPVAYAFGGVASAGNPVGGFLVGGGRFTFPCPAPFQLLTFWVNFGVSAHTAGPTAGPTRGGTANFTIPAGQCVGPSHLTTKPNCLLIEASAPKPPAGAWKAYVRSEVTQTQGDWFSKNPVGSQIRTGWKDTGNPGKQLSNDRFAASENPGGCPGDEGPDPDGSNSREIFPGNITIHAAR
jgi:hypothetical protein